MENLLFEEIIKLEKALSNLNPHSVMTATLTADSVGSLSALKFIDRFAMLRLCKPFEKSALQNYYCIQYTHPTRNNITMIIKTREIPQSK